MYFIRATSDGVRRYIVDEADPLTFTTVAYEWGKDKLRVFYQLNAVKNADPATFRVMANLDSAKDKNHIYYQGEKVK